MTPLKQIVAQFLRESGLEHSYHRQMIGEYWRQAVGDHIANQSTIRHLDGTSLYVSIGSAPWRAELLQRRHTIAATINQIAGLELVQTIHVR